MRNTICSLLHLAIVSLAFFMPRTSLSSETCADSAFGAIRALLQVDFVEAEWEEGCAFKLRWGVPQALPFASFSLEGASFTLGNFRDSVATSEDTNFTHESSLCPDSLDHAFLDSSRGEPTCQPIRENTGCWQARDPRKRAPLGVSAGMSLRLLTFTNETQTACALNRLVGSMTGRSEDLDTVKYVQAVKSPPLLALMYTNALIIIDADCEIFSRASSWRRFLERIMAQLPPVLARVIVDCGGPLEYERLDGNH